MSTCILSVFHYTLHQPTRKSASRIIKALDTLCILHVDDNTETLPIDIADPKFEKSSEHTHRVSRIYNISNLHPADKGRDNFAGALTLGEMHERRHFWHLKLHIAL